MMDWTPPPPLACSRTPIHAPTPPIFAAEIRKKRNGRMRALSGWRWHLDEVFVKINGERHYLWRAVDQEGEVLTAFVSKKRDRKAALKFLIEFLLLH